MILDKMLLCALYVRWNDQRVHLQVRVWCTVLCAQCIHLLSCNRFVRFSRLGFFFAGGMDKSVSVCMFSSFRQPASANSHCFFFVYAILTATYVGLSNTRGQHDAERANMGRYSRRSSRIADLSNRRAEGGEQCRFAEFRTHQLPLAVPTKPPVL